MQQTTWGGGLGLQILGTDAETRSAAVRGEPCGSLLGVVERPCYLSRLVVLASLGWGAGREGDRSHCLFVTPNQSDRGPETAEGTLAEQAG